MATRKNHSRQLADMLKEHGVTVKALARSSGIPANTLRRWCSSSYCTRRLHLVLVGHIAEQATLKTDQGQEMTVAALLLARKTT